MIIEHLSFQLVHVRGEEEDMSSHMSAPEFQQSTYSSKEDEG